MRVNKVFGILSMILVMSICSLPVNASSGNIDILLQSSEYSDKYVMSLDKSYKVATYTVNGRTFKREDNPSIYQLYNEVGDLSISGLKLFKGDGDLLNYDRDYITVSILRKSTTDIKGMQRDAGPAILAGNAASTDDDLNAIYGYNVGLGDAESTVSYYIEPYGYSVIDLFGNSSVLSISGLLDNKTEDAKVIKDNVLEVLDKLQVKVGR